MKNRIDEAKLVARRAASKRYNERHPDRVKARKRRNNLAKYGLTVEEFDAMNAEQGGLCYLCDKGPIRWPNLSVDHCHVTGRIRKLLCEDCNRGLGVFKDDPVLLRKAVDYLEAYECES